MPKKPVAFRFSEEAIRLLKELAKSKGVSQAAILEIAIREASKREGIK
jgi:hypothetical protein